MGLPGRPSVYTPELLSKIREGLLAGRTQESIKEELEIPNSTWCTWFYDNYEGFRDQVEGWRRDAMLKQAESNLKEIIHLPVSTEDTKLTKIIADTSMFVSETLGKKVYSKRSEQTGADGKDLPTPIININREVSSDNSVQQDKQPE